MKVSIITVCFNAAATIRPTLESLRMQSYWPLELVVVDGGSTDGTPDIVREYTDLLGAWVSEPDKGIYDAMNKALRMVSGDIVFFLNAGDRFLDKHVLADVVKAFKQSDAQMIFGDVARVYPGATQLRDQSRTSRSNIMFEGLCHQSVFTRREVFSEIGGFDLQYSICADFDWIVRVFKHGYRCRHISRVIARYPMDGVSERQVDRRRLQIKWIQAKYIPMRLVTPVWLVYKIFRRAKRLLVAASPQPVPGRCA